ncbi:GAF domain-containing protein [Dawidia soli]|uniref:GAF domain-containing protein n=1 Tax=Dawidia soli TaxID=2782352 RepID=A0AAP2DFF5_9BACT|nr:GAF domain-containing protein [Dawidia soli]MBT1690272.1 GAF domain-containing protein [Dawidia soli]
MTGLFNDRYYLNVILAVLFMAGIIISLYLIYSLPAELRLTDGYQPAFTGIYLTIGATFLLGALTLTASLRYQKEVVVMRDRVIDAAQAKRDEAEQAGKTSISLDTVKNSLQQARNQKDILNNGLQAICKQLDAGQGALYLAREDDGKRTVELHNGYALAVGESTVIRFEFGEGLVGQAAASARTLYVDDVPAGYIKIISGLGSASPRYLLIVPIKQQAQVLGIVEIASFTNITEDQRKFVEEAAQLVADKISTKA